MGPGMPLNKSPGHLHIKLRSIGLDLEQALPGGVSRPAGSASPGNLVERQIFIFSKSMKSEALWVGLNGLVLISFPEDSDAQQSLRTTSLKCEDRHD